MDFNRDLNSWGYIDPRGYFHAHPYEQPSCNMLCEFLRFLKDTPAPTNPGHGCGSRPESVR